MYFVMKKLRNGEIEVIEAALSVSAAIETAYNACAVFEVYDNETYKVVGYDKDNNPIIIKKLQ